MAVGAWKFSYLFPEKKRVNPTLKNGDDTGSTTASEASFATPPTVEELLTGKNPNGKIVNEHFAKTGKHFFQEGQKFSEQFRNVEGSKLGTGMNGGVMEVQRVDDPESPKFALKKLVKRQEHDGLFGLVTPKKLQQHRAEVNTYLHLATTTPNDYTNYFPRLEAIFEDDDAVWIVMEKCAGGELFNALKLNREVFPYALRAEVNKKAKANVVKLHELGIMHRDIKPENFLFCPATMTEESYTPEARDLRLMDFGFAAPFSAILTDSLGTPGYAAPAVVETASKRWYSAEVDNWSILITQFVVLAAAMPYQANLVNHENPFYLNQAIRDGTAFWWPQRIKTKYGPKTEKDLSAIFKELKELTRKHIESRKQSQVDSVIETDVVKPPTSCWWWFCC